MADAARRDEALTELTAALELPRVPDRIECYDMSNIQGTSAVGSMVVFVDGRPEPKEYRRFRIRSGDTPDDFRMMAEVLRRRFSRVAKLRSETGALSLAAALTLVLGGVLVNACDKQEAPKPDDKKAVAKADEKKAG